MIQLFMYMPMTLVAATGETFDVVCSSEVIEHVEDPDSFVGNLSGLLKKEGGDLVMSTINRTLKSYLIAILGAEYITGIVPRGKKTPPVASKQTHLLHSSI